MRTAEGMWIVPANRAVWIPAKVPHSVTMAGNVSMRTLYLRPRLARHMPRVCRVLSVKPLLRELILHTCELKSLKSRLRLHAHLAELIVEQLKAGETIGLELPHPSDERARRVAEALMRDPSDQRSMAEICRTAGASKRTVERLFQSEVNMRLGEWRRQLRLIQSLTLLASGEKISSIALDSGYNTASAYIAMFRKALGTTPRRYFEQAD